MTDIGEVQLFNNGEFQLRVHPDGDTFKVEAPDLARALGFREAYDLVRSLPDKYKGSAKIRTPGGDQEIWLVSEPGLYRAIGQRQVSRIRNVAVRVQVERFQDWVFEEVIPALRKHGAYEVGDRPHPRMLMERFDEPQTFTWDVAAAQIEQRYGMPLTAYRLREILRSAGVLKQTGAPSADYRAKWFWHTGTAWDIHPFALPQIAQKVYDTLRGLQEAKFMQARLELEGMPSWPEPVSGRVPRSVKSRPAPGSSSGAAA